MSAALQVAEKVLYAVILSEAKNLSFFVFLPLEQRFFAPLRMTEIVIFSATCLAAKVHI
jgi:hypothetical protein